MCVGAPSIKTSSLKQLKQLSLNFSPSLFAQILKLVRNTNTTMKSA